MPVNYEFDKKRFEAFVDAIFAILLTVLVLEIRVPESEMENGSTFEQIRSLTPFIVSYLGSFMLLVGFWIDYHLLFVNITSLTKRFIILNMLFILSISFAPFVTAFAGKHYHDPFAVALLSTTYFLMNLIFFFVFLYAKNKNLANKTFWQNNKKNGMYSALGVVAILVAIPMSYVNTYIPFAIFIITFGWHLIKKKSF